ncbi:hypothetical protein QAD02_018812 [Eretmocerus hayati]|uniref:Uncharacterized protein n=1 Tax=Eretmocerus hayati TaxID=131215 RepID=A0ACC2PHE6_9HYME|nr:hypothetical protein QAD02_018812 [Eretmocerus hayati]
MSFAIAALWNVLYLCEIHYPDWEEISGDPLIELMRARRELVTADAELQAKREEYARRRAHGDKLWLDMREKQQLLRDSFISFNEFVKENKDKRERARRKIDDESQRQSIRLAEIEELEKNLEYMEQVRDKMKGFVREYKPYQDYLETLLDTKEFQSINEIFNRYDTLIHARLALMENQAHNLHTLEQTGVQLQKMTEDKSQSLMDMNSRLSQLQSRHERARNRALYWELVVARIKEVASRKELEETQVRACIWNLYQQICKRKGIEIEAKKDDLEQQLEHVKRAIVGLGKIVITAKRNAARDKRQQLQIELQQHQQHQERPSGRSSSLQQIASSRLETRTSSFRSSYDETRSLYGRN